MTKTSLSTKRLLHSDTDQYKQNTALDTKQNYISSEALIRFASKCDNGSLIFSFQQVEREKKNEMSRDVRKVCSFSSSFSRRLSCPSLEVLNREFRTPQNIGT